MANTTFNTRIQSKYDLYANWTSKNPKLLSGELAVVVIPSESGIATTEPTILFKVGDGEKNFNDLGWASALAGDVYGWAKAATKPSYTAEEIEGLDAFIAGEIEDTDTQYRIVKVDDYNYKLQKKNKGEADTAFTDVTDGGIVIPKYDDSGVVADIADLKTLVGTTAVATQIANAIAALNLAETYEAKGAATQALADAKAYADGKDEAIAAAKKAGDDAQTAADNAQSDVDALAAKVGTVADGQTVMGIIQNIQENAYDDTQVKADIQTNADEIAAIKGDYLKNADKTELTEAIATAKQEAIEAVLDGVTDDFDTLKEVAAWIQSDTTASAELVTRVSSIEADYLKGADKTSLQAEIDALEKLVGTLPEDAVSTTVVAYIREVVDALKIGDYAKVSDLTALANRVAALEDKAHTHENADILAGITAEKVASWDKVSEKANDADLADIAKTGNVNDLIQTSGDYIIFNCGSATEVI